MESGRDEVKNGDSGENREEGELFIKNRKRWRRKGHRHKIKLMEKKKKPKKKRK
jgi:hypothetical protein